MNNQLTTDQLKELLEIQKEFDSRIPTLNLQDSKVAYVVEFFEWFNTLETFKNWKKKPGKPLDVQLDELADMLAFGLSIANQTLGNSDFGTKDDEIEVATEIINENDLTLDFSYERGTRRYLTSIVSTTLRNDIEPLQQALRALHIAMSYYSIDQLIQAYKKKMERNHARQDGTEDKDKGYV
ncbi:dUTPase [Mammaliicoccus sciuri]|uniref:dUTPase n=1 Tax=Mammaliicoccus sciuri TaxID=1296 RepID=UPI001FB54EF4|nr:dUTPase [Mammaliicoccus sciuri]MCJ1780413.1 dUTPase [Mammaliicoccus sciuri]